MSKPAKKRPVASSATRAPASAPSQTNASDAKDKKATAISKHSRVVAMLQSPTGTTIAAMMKATGWQQHSVRGFLAGVVRKRLKLKLRSDQVDGNRLYRVASGGNGLSGARELKRSSH